LKMSDTRKKFTEMMVSEELDESIVTRRCFLVSAGGAVGLTTAACLGIPVISMAKKKDIKFTEMSCGEKEGTTRRILVAYASMFGSTGGVAEAMARELCAAGAACDVRLIEKVNDLGPYHAVVLGSAIRSGRWLSEASGFVDKHKESLSKLPVAYFMTCLQVVPGQPAFSTKGRPPKDETLEDKRRRVRAYLDPVLKKAPEVKPLDIGIFAGALDFAKLSPGAKAMMNSVGFIEGDFRDWEAIRGWARAITPALLKA
jgi:menaquinone-dependent protoporphyrinogen oxidase